jgi:hypothetical protein
VSGLGGTSGLASGGAKVLNRVPLGRLPGGAVIVLNDRASPVHLGRPNYLVRFDFSIFLNSARFVKYKVHFIYSKIYQALHECTLNHDEQLSFWR